MEGPATNWRSRRRMGGPNRGNGRFQNTRGACTRSPATTRAGARNCCGPFRGALPSCRGRATSAAPRCCWRGRARCGRSESGFIVVDARQVAVVARRAHAELERPTVVRVVGVPAGDPGAAHGRGRRTGRASAKPATMGTASAASRGWRCSVATLASRCRCRRRTCCSSRAAARASRRSAPSTSRARVARGSRSWAAAVPMPTPRSPRTSRASKPREYGSGTSWPTSPTPSRCAPRCGRSSPRSARSPPCSTAPAPTSRGPSPARCRGVRHTLAPKLRGLAT